MDLELIYEDEYLVAVNKPPDLLVHATRLFPGERYACLQMLRDQLGHRVFTVHRLDRKTSGVLLFCKESGFQAEVDGLFREKRVTKTYAAVVRGWIEEPFTSERPLRKPDTEVIQDAVSHFTPMEKAELPEAVGRYDTARLCLVGVKPETGRTHQIRRHLKHAAHPILGDTVHGDGRYNTFARGSLACGRMCLHAVSLSFVHPFLGEPVEIKAPMEAQMASMCRRLGWGARVDAFM